MESVSSEKNIDFKFTADNETAMCRFCLSTNKQMKNISSVALLFQDLTGIQVILFISYIQ